MSEQLNYQQLYATYTPQFGPSSILNLQSQTQPTLLSQQSMVQQEFQQENKLQTLKSMPSLTATFQDLRKHHETKDKNIKQMAFVPQRVDLSVKRRLLSISKTIDAQEQICPSKSVHDIDLSKVRKYFKRKEVKPKVKQPNGEFKRQKLLLGSQNLAKDVSNSKGNLSQSNSGLLLISPSSRSNAIESHQQIPSDRVLVSVNDSRHANLTQNAPVKQLNLSDFKDNLNCFQSPSQVLITNSDNCNQNCINQAKENINYQDAHSNQQKNSKLLFTPVRNPPENSLQSPNPQQDQQFKQYGPTKKTKGIQKQLPDKIPRQVQLQYFWAKRQYDYLKQRAFRVFEDRTQILPVSCSNTTQNSQSLMSTQSTFCSTFDHISSNKQCYDKDYPMHFETTSFCNDDEQSNSQPLYCSQVISEQKEILLRRFEDQSQKNKMNKIMEQQQLRMMHQIDFQMQQQQQQSSLSIMGSFNGLNPTLTTTVIVNSETQVSVRNTQDSQVDFTQRVVIGTPSEEGSQDQLNRSNLQYSNHLSNSFSCLDDINSQSYSNSSSQTVIRPFNLINSPESSFSNDDYYRQ